MTVPRELTHHLSLSDLIVFEFRIKTHNDYTFFLRNALQFPSQKNLTDWYPTHNHTIHLSFHKELPSHHCNALGTKHSTSTLHQHNYLYKKSIIFRRILITLFYLSVNLAEFLCTTGGRRICKIKYDVITYLYTLQPLCIW